MVTLLIVHPNPDEQPLDWTVRDQPLYGPPAAAIQPAGWTPTEPYPPTSAPPVPYSPAPYGQNYYPPQPQLIFVQKLPRTGVAVAALVLMLISVTGALCLFSWLPAVLAVVCGHFALHEVKNANGRLRGRDMAIWSLIGAYPVAAFWTIGIVYGLVNHSLNTSL